MNDLMVCPDCIQVIANGDLGGREEEAERLPEIEAAMAGFDGQLAAGDGARDASFSWARCECCDSRLAGSRHHAVELVSARQAAA